MFKFFKLRKQLKQLELEGLRSQLILAEDLNKCSNTLIAAQSALIENYHATLELLEARNKKLESRELELTALKAAIPHLRNKSLYQAIKHYRYVYQKAGDDIGMLRAKQALMEIWPLE